MLKSAPQRRRNGPRPGADLGDPAVWVVSHHHAARVTCKALRRFCRNARSALEHGLARPIGIREHLHVDVDHHLIALARRTGIDSVMERCLREQRQGVGLLLLHRRRFRRIDQ